MKVRAPVLLIAIFALSCSSAPKESKEPTKSAPAAVSIDVERARVFTGPDGVRAEVAEFEGGTKALVKITGTRTEFEGLVLEHEIKDDGTYLRYLTQLHGRTRATLVRETRRGANPRWKMWIDYRQQLDMEFDEKASEVLDTKSLVSEHASQKGAGTLDELQRFDLDAEKARATSELAEEMERVKSVCGFEMPVSIDWSTVTPEMFTKLSISGYCDSPMSAMRSLCKYPPGKAFFNQVNKVECRFGDALALDVSGGTLTWTPSVEGSNMDQFALDALRATKYKGKTLQYHVKISETDVCTDKDKEHYIVLAPEGAENPGVLYGDGKSFYRTESPRMMGLGWFFEPRHYNPKYNSNFRGYDLRSFSKVDVDRDDGECTLICGGRSTEFVLLSGEAAAKVARGVKVVTGPMEREPYRLARDRRGTYYYVDRGTEKGRERDFKLYVGKLGNVKLQRMKDIVADSQGEIFSSKNGELRLIFDKDQKSFEKAFWIKGKKRSPLTPVPVEENYEMIYNKLGPYIGKRLGNPCDDFGVE